MVAELWLVLGAAPPTPRSPGQGGVQAGEEEAQVFVPFRSHERHLAFLMFAWCSDLGR